MTDEAQTLNAQQVRAALRARRRFQIELVPANVIDGTFSTWMLFKRYWGPGHMDYYNSQAPVRGPYSVLHVARVLRSRINRSWLEDEAKAKAILRRRHMKGTLTVIDGGKLTADEVCGPDGYQPSAQLARTLPAVAL